MRLKVDVASIKLKNIKRVIKDFAKVVKNLENPQKAMSTIATMGLKDVDEHFRNEKGPSGRWKPLAKSRSRKRDKGGQLILNDTGILKGSIRGKAIKKQAVISTNVDYADFHQHQKKRYKRPPQRKFLWISKKAREAIAKILGKFIVKI